MLITTIHQILVQKSWYFYYIKMYETLKSGSIRFKQGFYIS